MLQHEAEYIDARPLTTDSSNLLATHGRTIHLGQERTFRHLRSMSAIPLKADIHNASEMSVCQRRTSPSALTPRPYIFIFIFIPPPLAVPGAVAPTARIGYSTSTLPALSNFSVTLTVLPSSSACFRSRNMTWKPAGASVTVSPGFISRPPSTGRIFITPPSIVMLWISHCALASSETQLTLSGIVPLFVIVM